MSYGRNGQIPIQELILRPFPSAGASSHLSRDQQGDARILYLEAIRDSTKADILSQATGTEPRLPILTNGFPDHLPTGPVPEPNDLFLDSLESRFDPNRHKKPVFQPSRTSRLSLSGSTADLNNIFLPLALETIQKSWKYNTQATTTLEKYYASKRRDPERTASLDQLYIGNGTANANWGGYERDRDPRLAGRSSIGQAISSATLIKTSQTHG